MAKLPLISVIIPCKNRQNLLEELLICIEQQKTNYKKDLEVVIVDDGSEPPLDVKKSGYSYNIKVLRNDRSLGAPLSRKRGFMNSSGNLIHFHDSDDLFATDWLEQVVNLFLNAPSLDMVITPRLKVNSDKRKVTHSEELARLVKNKSLFIKIQKFTNVIGPLGGVSFRRRVARHFSFHDVPASQDWLMYDEALLQARKVHYLEATYFVFRDLEIDRISSSPERRLSGYSAAAKLRFKSKLFQYIAKQIYIAGAPRDFRKSHGNVISGLIRVTLKGAVKIGSRV